MRIAAALFFVVFAFAAGVQWNDPDPVPWILAYGAVAAISLAAAFGRAWLAPSAGAALLLGLWCLALAPSLIGAESEAFLSIRMRETRHEQPREALGLALAAGWCAFLAWRSRPRARALPPG